MPAKRVLKVAKKPAMKASTCQKKPAAKCVQKKPAAKCVQKKPAQKKPATKDAIATRDEDDCSYESGLESSPDVCVSSDDNNVSDDNVTVSDDNVTLAWVLEPLRVRLFDFRRVTAEDYERALSEPASTSSHA